MNLFSRRLARHRLLPVIAVICAVTVTAFAYHIIDSTPLPQAITVDAVDITASGETAVSKKLGEKLGVKSRFFYWNYDGLASAAALDGCTVEQELLSRLRTDSADIILLDLNALRTLAPLGYLAPVDTAALPGPAVQQAATVDGVTYGIIIEGTDLMNTGCVYSEEGYGTVACAAVFAYSDNADLAAQALALLAGCIK